MTRKIAFLYPGQGSQTVGMGKAWAEALPAASAVFAKADELLGRPLGEVCFDGPEEALKQTANTQPGLYVCGVAGTALLRERGVTPDAVAGHSLGEYAALAAANVFDWETGLQLVRVRGEAMNEAAEAVPGAMAAILGLSDEAVAQACEAAASAGIVTAANFNGEGQVVISGSPEGVAAAVEACQSAGAKRALPLPVHGAFHSPLMAPATERMREALAAATMRAPETTFIANVTGDTLDSVEDIRDALTRQVVSSVQWTRTMRRLLDLGIEVFVEVGPGKTLSGMMKRMDRKATCLPCSTPEDIDRVVEACNE